MNKRPASSGQAYYALAVLVSLVILSLTVILVFYISDTLQYHTENLHIKQIIFLEIIAFFALMELFGAYRIGKTRLFKFVYSTLASALLANLLLLLLPRFDIAYFSSWVPVFILWVMQSFLLTLWSIFFHNLYFFLFPRRQAIVVAPLSEKADYCTSKVLQYSREFDVLEKLTTSASLAALPELADRCDVVIAYQLAAAERYELGRRCLEQGLEFCVVPDFYELSLQKSRELQFGDLLAFSTNSLHISMEQRFIKRMLDIFLSLLGLLVLAIPIGLLALIVFLQDRKNPFFVQERLTRQGRVFNIYKLRTMVPNAEQDTGPSLAMLNDPRVTRFGRFLRKTRLDELPQLLNIIKGDMSLVGPRPERAYFAAEYEKEVPGFGLRLSVRAGLTGMAHVYGRYDTPPAERFNLDLYYIMNYSLLLDIKLMIETVLIVFSPSYAQGVKGDRPL